MGRHPNDTADAKTGNRILWKDVPYEKGYPEAGHLLTFTVEGPAEIVGVINGDIISDELTTGNQRSLYRGVATVILRSGRESGAVTLTASAPGPPEN